MVARKIFFDLDGTLLGSDERSFRLYRDILKKNHFRPLPKEKYIALKKKRASIQNILKKTRAASISPKFIKEWAQNIEADEYLAYDYLFAWTTHILEQLRGDFQLYLVTLRKNRRGLTKELRELNIRHYFKKILVVPRQSNDATKTVALRRFARKCDIIVGDSERDIRAGKALGMITVAVKTGFRSPSLLRKENPDYLISTTKQLLSLPFITKK